jgi:hypothetical protein
MAGKTLATFFRSARRTRGNPMSDDEIDEMDIRYTPAGSAPLPLFP